jgi:hypothetical protein
MNTNRPPTTWYMATDREWTTEAGGAVDVALSTLAQLKEEFDAEMDFVLVDKNQQSVQPDGQEMATICFYIVVKDRHDAIEPQLREIGLVQAAL